MHKTKNVNYKWLKNYFTNQSNHFFFSSLLQKKRKPKEPEYFRKPYQWNQITGKVLEPQVMPDGDCSYVFPLHRPPALADFISAEKKKMKKHVHDLYRIASDSDSFQ